MKKSELKAIIYETVIEALNDAINQSDRQSLTEGLFKRNGSAIQNATKRSMNEHSSKGGYVSGSGILDWYSNDETKVSSKNTDQVEELDIYIKGIMKQNS